MSLSKPTRDILITARDKNERMERLLDRIELLEASLLDIRTSDDMGAVRAKVDAVFRPEPVHHFAPNVIAFPAGGSR